MDSKCFQINPVPKQNLQPESSAAGHCEMMMTSAGSPASEPTGDKLTNRFKRLNKTA